VRLSNDRRCVALRARARAQSSARELFLSIIFTPAPPASPSSRPPDILEEDGRYLFYSSAIRLPLDDHAVASWSKVADLSLSLSLSLSRALFLLFLQTPLRRRVYHQLAQLDYARPSCSPSGNDTCPPPSLPPSLRGRRREGTNHGDVQVTVVHSRS